MPISAKNAFFEESLKCKNWKKCHWKKWIFYYSKIARSMASKFCIFLKISNFKKLAGSFGKVREWLRWLERSNYISLTFCWFLFRKKTFCWPFVDFWKNIFFQFFTPKIGRSIASKFSKNYVLVNSYICAKNDLKCVFKIKFIKISVRT